jgi:hypothetical protein
VRNRIRADVLCHVVETRKLAVALMIGETFSPKTSGLYFFELTSGVARHDLYSTCSCFFRGEIEAQASRRNLSKS